MPKTYVVLINFTGQGIRTISDWPDRVDKARQAIEKAGGSLQVFLTMGDYDVVSIVELPNDEVAASVLLSLGRLGNLRSTTLKAFPEEEARRIIQGLPSA